MYRCWVVYGRRKAVLFFPAFLWVLGFICTILQVYWQIVESATQQKWKVVNMSIGPGMILIPFWATTLLINIYSMCKSFLCPVSFEARTNMLRESHPHVSNLECDEEIAWGWKRSDFAVYPAHLGRVWIPLLFDDNRTLRRMVHAQRPRY